MRPSEMLCGVKPRICPAARSGRAASPRSWASTLPVPSGMTPIIAVLSATPCRTSKTVPSPPQANTASQPARIAARACSPAEPAPRWPQPATSTPARRKSLRNPAHRGRAILQMGSGDRIEQQQGFMESRHRVGQTASRNQSISHAFDGSRIRTLRNAASSDCARAARLRSRSAGRRDRRQAPRRTSVSAAAESRCASSNRRNASSSTDWVLWVIVRGHSPCSKSIRNVPSVQATTTYTAASPLTSPRRGMHQLAVVELHLALLSFVADRQTAALASDIQGLQQVHHRHLRQVAADAAGIGGLARRLAQTDAVEYALDARRRIFDEERLLDELFHQRAAARQGAAHIGARRQQHHRQVQGRTGAAWPVVPARSAPACGSRRRSGPASARPPCVVPRRRWHSPRCRPVAAVIRAAARGCEDCRLPAERVCPRP